MSSGSHDTHAAIDHDHAFDGEPTDVLAEDEPRTPGWLPVLGAVLFVSAAVAFLATRGPAAQPTAPAAERPVAAAAVAPQLQQPVRPAQAAAPTPPPAQSGAADTLRRLSPDQLRGLQKQIEGMKAKQAAGGTAPAQPQK
jgi:hypothetical protein